MRLEAECVEVALPDEVNQMELFRTKKSQPVELFGLKDVLEAAQNRPYSA